MTTTQTTAGPSTAPSSSSPKDVQDPATASSSCRAAAGETAPAAPLSPPRTRGRKGLPLPPYYRVAITDQLHARPELRAALPLADVIDAAGRWNA